MLKPSLQSSFEEPDCFSLSKLKVNTFLVLSLAVKSQDQFSILPLILTHKDLNKKFLYALGNFLQKSI